MEDLGNSRGGVGMYAGGTISAEPELKVFWGLGCHRIDSMQAARGGVDGGAGGSDR